ncbi:MAG: flagellar biosynthesis protein FlhA [Burkholderiales bacterium]|nr:flagellar biosynthesis protein FlhA [Burkholderiales bacterium]MCA3162572.1 flagellar biosynthesis protein FlhA [Burkholderiales bacterium]MCA3163349.1 flagellar biosynthesis protein FlhA [Burkholderiales bacterium]MCA3166641.1 flagellar biosynthesis protein FlhA [Burkholderiales bacterium]MCA3170149.1 flagellar biosynthesis protein FlhA [Burkholderiales bacterium]
MNWMTRLRTLYGIDLKMLAMPVFIVLILAMMVLPLPPFLLDLFFTFNITLSIVVLLVSSYTKKPLEFAIFPTVLLVTTLMRLALNVASTRVILLEGHTGPDAAGKVIDSFAHFLVGGNFAVGLVVFIILVIINFIVVTKGAGRIAEVSARFTLDAMPGKQMAIDADLNAGLIGEADARKRRQELAQEADFYGSMDGASKFVRGDAIAGILILFINIIGGIAIGMFQHNLTAGQSAETYVLLAIGDGLVAQVPALVISIAAGLIVSRVGTGEDIGEQMASQLFNMPRALGITAAIMALLGFIPNMPHFPFLMLAGSCAYLAWWLSQREKSRKAAESAAQEVVPATLNNGNEATWEDLQPVDVLGLEVGYRLIPLVDINQDGELLKRIKGIRKKFAQEVGFLPPAVHIRDNLGLRPNQYRITLKGATMAEGETVNGMFLAIDPGGVTAQLPGTPTRDPAFGLPAVWIDNTLRSMAQVSGYTVVDAATVVATHLNHILQMHASALLGRTEVQSLLDHIGKLMPKLVEDIIPKVASIPIFQKVLQNLLSEGVHIRDMRTIIETMAEHAPHLQDSFELTAQVRTALGPAIVQQIYGYAAELPVIVLEPELERVITQTVGKTNEAVGLEPNLADALVRHAVEVTQQQEAAGLPAALLVPDAIRLPMSRLLRRLAPRLRVIGHGEIPETSTIRVSSILGAST